MSTFERTLIAGMARKAGLEDPSDFAARGGVWADVPGHSAARCRAEVLAGRSRRGTGRTTYALLTAMVALKCGMTVVLVMPDHDMATIARERLHALASAMGPHCGWATCLRVTWPKDDAPASGADIVIVDHAAIDEGHGACTSWSAPAVSG